MSPPVCNGQVAPSNLLRSHHSEWDLCAIRGDFFILLSIVCVIRGDDKVWQADGCVLDGVLGWPADACRWCGCQDAQELGVLPQLGVGGIPGAPHRGADGPKSGPQTAPMQTPRTYPMLLLDVGDTLPGTLLRPPLRLLWLQRLLGVLSLLRFLLILLTFRHILVLLILLHLLLLLLGLRSPLGVKTLLLLLFFRLVLLREPGGQQVGASLPSSLLLCEE